MKKSPPVLVLAGPTASGKTDVAIALARRIDAEILSADSRQIYKEFQIGTAKPAGGWQVMGGIPRFVSGGVVHHLVDFLPPAEIFTAGRFAREGQAILTDIAARGRRALVVGGTGLYLRALTRGLAPMPERDLEYRRSLAALAEERGRPYLHGRLEEVDPAAAKKIPPNNLQRVIRALEVHHLTGKGISQWQEGTQAPEMEFRWFGLRWPGVVLEERLRLRAQAMVGADLLGETESLLKQGIPESAPAFQSLGYREAMGRLRGQWTDSQWTEAFNLATRQYAKRQATWFRSEPGIHWIDLHPPFEPEKVADKIFAAL